MHTASWHWSGSCPADTAAPCGRDGTLAIEAAALRATLPKPRRSLLCVGPNDPVCGCAVVNGIGAIEHRFQ